LRLPGGTAVLDIPSISKKKVEYLSLDGLTKALPISVVRDSASGMNVLCTAYDCVPIYEMDETDVQKKDNLVFVNAETVAGVLGCTAEVKKNAIALNCAHGWDTVKVGSQAGNHAPGFRLKSAADTLPNSPPSVFSSDLLSTHALLLVFFRAGDWDTAGKFLLRNLQARLDSLRGAGVAVVAVHGYEPRAAAKWVKALGITFPVLSDDYSAVMRAYDVFDSGHLPRPAFFMIDKQGTIRVRHLIEDVYAVPDMNIIMGAVRELK
jgi:peroxiredoxin